jgi:hypothetical protein
MLFEHTFYVERGNPDVEDLYQELELVAKVWYDPGDPGGYWTAPVGDDIDVEDILFKGEVWDGKLTYEEEEDLIEECFEHAKEIIRSRMEDYYDD